MKPIQSATGNKVPWHYKAACLVTVTTLTTALVILVRFSKTGGGEPYAASTTIVLSELIKLTASLIALCVDRGSFKAFLHAVIYDIFCDPRETFKLLVPSGLYTLQNNLVYVALANLDAATYQITYQGKILTTALFAVLLLKKRITSRQWFSLILLTFGVALVQLRSIDIWTPSPENGNRVLGFLCVLISMFTSGVSGVYFEYLVKFGSPEKTNVPLRNSQLGLFSIAFSILVVLVNDYEFVATYGFFAGYTTIVWLVILTMAVSGLTIAVTLKYADNILKGFATSISIILTALISYFYLGDLNINWKFAMGTMLVLWSTFEYGRPNKDSSPGRAALKNQSSV